MNCYNIREIQTILKSKYTPCSSDSVDTHLKLSDTTIGLRYQLGELNFIDPYIFIYYKNALLAHPRYRAIHEFLHKPIIEFDSVKLFMGRCSLLYTILNALYNDDVINMNDAFSSAIMIYHTFSKLGSVLYLLNLNTLLNA
jgi:hypothetical protein